MHMFSDEFSGKEIVAQDGTKVGKVEKVVIDPATWRVLSLQVKLDGHVADRFDAKKYFGTTTILMDVAHIRTVGDNILLKSQAADLFRLTTHSEETPQVKEQVIRTEEPTTTRTQETTPTEEPRTQL